MPQIEIENINYVITGEKERIINFDFLNGERNVSFFTETDTDANSALDLANPGAIKNQSFCYSADRRNVNAHGYAYLDADKEIARALFDAKDVALKSALAERLTNKEASDLSTHGLDMYLPHLRNNPLGFAQKDGFSYGLTENTPVAPVLKTTSLSEDRKGFLSSNLSSYTFRPLWNSFLNPYDKLGSTQYDPGQLENLLPTYLYTPLKNLKYAAEQILSSQYEDSSKLSAAVDSVTSSYYAFKNFLNAETGSDSMISVLFKPVYNFKGIDHNYIMEVPLEGQQMPDNEYYLGTIMADMIGGKNAYDDIYGMAVSSVGKFERIREYKNIHQTRNKIFLTYYDDNCYNANGSYTNTYLNNTEDVEENKQPHGQRDYMKIEQIAAINRFVSLTNHKANVYSTKIYGFQEALRSANVSSAEQIENIQTSIKNSIRRIVSNFTPAHTQYYDMVEWNNSRKALNGEIDGC